MKGCNVLDRYASNQDFICRIIILANKVLSQNRGEIVNFGGKKSLKHAQYYYQPN